MFTLYSRFFMTTSSVAGNVPVNEASNSEYRLWRLFPISEGAPNVILVHGAVVPWDWHVKDAPNNNRCGGFHELGSLLQRICGYNVWEFEYADLCIWLEKERCVNYGCLDTYGERLIEAIKTVRTKNLNDTVYIIAHSMGGLVARYAAQKMSKMSKGTIDKIITLDTGHFGFEIAAFVPLVSFDMASRDILPLIQKGSILRRVCVLKQARPGSQFLCELAKHFTHGRPKLLSLAARQPISWAQLDVPTRPNVKAWGIPVVSMTSSSLVHVSGDGRTRSNKRKTPFLILDNCNHLNVAEIKDANHPAFVHITNFLTTGSINQPVSHPLGDPYFTVMLSEKPQSGCPKIQSPQNLSTSKDSIDDAGHHAVIFKVQNVQGYQYIQIKYAPDQYVRGRLTMGQSTIRTDIIPN
jgi:pimeloyl-ACP methyl ester carboxylesterase